MIVSFPFMYASTDASIFCEAENPHVLIVVELSLSMTNVYSKATHQRVNCRKIATFNSLPPLNPVKLLTKSVIVINDQYSRFL